MYPASNYVFAIVTKAGSSISQTNPSGAEFGMPEETPLAGYTYIDPLQDIPPTQFNVQQVYPNLAVPHFPWPAHLTPPNDYQQNPGTSAIPRAISSDYHLYYQLFQDDKPHAPTHQQLTAPNTNEPPLPEVVSFIRDDVTISQTASAAGPAEQAWDKSPTQHQATWPSTETSQQTGQNIYAQTPTNFSTPTTPASSTSPHNAYVPEYTTHPSVEQPNADAPQASSARPSNILHAELPLAPFSLKDPESRPGRQLAFVLLPSSNPAWSVDDSPKPSFHPGLPPPAVYSPSRIVTAQNENHIHLMHKSTLSRHSTAPFNDFNTSGKEVKIHPRTVDLHNLFGQISRTGHLTSSKPPLVELKKAQTDYQNQSPSTAKQSFERYESASGLDQALGGEIARLPKSFTQAISQPAPAEVKSLQPSQKRKCRTDEEPSPSTSASSSTSTKRKKSSHTVPSPETIRALASGLDQAFGGEMARLPRPPPQATAQPVPAKAKPQPTSRKRKDRTDEDSSSSTSASSSTKNMKKSHSTPSPEEMWKEAAALIAAASPHYKPILPRRRPSMTFGSWQAYDSKDVGSRTPSARSRVGSGASFRRM